MKRLSTWSTTLAMALALCFTMCPPASAQNSGFMVDYSIFDDVDAEELKVLEGEYLDQIYLRPGWREFASDATSIMVDQPEVWVDPESKYKGIKPDAIKVLADSFRQGLTENLAQEFEIVDEPGPGVIYVHWAITDLYLAKKKKSPLSYTPAGMVLSGAKNAVISDIWKKVDMVEMTLEVEMIDADTGEILAAGIIMEGARKDKKAGQKKRDPVTWDEVDALVDTLAARMGCRIKNSKRAEADREDCLALTVVAEKI